MGGFGRVSKWLVREEIPVQKEPLHAVYINAAFRSSVEQVRGSEESRLVAAAKCGQGRRCGLRHRQHHNRPAEGTWEETMPTVLPRPVTFVTGNAKKLEEVRAILGPSIPFQSLKLDRN
ncbi:hypothetical protein GW17_00028643 [Ensete ventricosum]|nr:hypothetical protein GW17_00028643 [Ensete ventricosum]RZS01735.1 hypothetical protein BHM03_00031654 [Ensete ventricosum]